MEKVRIGIVGAGNISTNAHMPAYAACGGAEIAAVADIDLERAKAFAERFNVPQAYSSVEELLANADIDAVDICTWNRGHAPVAIAAARAGKHILCEKPLAADLASAQEMREAIEKSGVHFLLGVPSRFAPENVMTREMLDKGELGEVYYAKTSYLRRRGTPTGWFTDSRAAGGGAVLDIGVHRIDAAWYLMGNPRPVRVSAAVSNRFGEFETKGVERWKGTPCPDNCNDTEDFGAGVIHFENGAILLFEASWALNGPGYEYTQLFGTRGGVTLDPLTVYGEHNGYLSDNRLNAGPGQKFELEIRHFLDMIRTGAPSLVPIEQACQLQQMLQGVYDSARLGREVIL
ncbi:MAG: Gfo/Idh/MocA family oxidoreductase [Clostridiales bacterium]|nr:Gfo/Idh/MocA family oxidoreductase [Clostridiales bacterium]